MGTPLDVAQGTLFWPQITRPTSPALSSPSTAACGAVKIPRSFFKRIKKQALLESLLFLLTNRLFTACWHGNIESPWNLPLTLATKLLTRGRGSARLYSPAIPHLQHSHGHITETIPTLEPTNHIHFTLKNPGCKCKSCVNGIPNSC